MVEESKAAGAKPAITVTKEHDSEEQKKEEAPNAQPVDKPLSAVEQMKALYKKSREQTKGVSAPKSRPKVSNVGKALSLEHATRMVEHAKINPVTSKEARRKAVGTEADFPNDAMASYLVRHAEEIFEPKRVLDPFDWLKKYREPD